MTFMADLAGPGSSKSRDSSLHLPSMSRTPPEKIFYVDPQKRPNPFVRAFDSFRPHKDDVPSLNHELSNFQMQMIAIGGSIGTGLFLGSGEALKTGGPAALIICWMLIGTMIYATVHSLCELAVTFPVPGGFSYYSSKFIDDSWGYAMALNYALQWLILLPLELSAATMTFKYWHGFPIPDWALITIFFVVIIAINLMSVKVYGYAEVVFSLTKVVAVVCFIVIGFVLVFGGFPLREAVLGQNWNEPGAFANGFKGVVAVFVTAAFSFAGTEMCGLAAAESQDPRKHVPKATKQVFWRICGFYFVCLTLIGLLVPYNNPRLVRRHESTGDASSSPFTMALEATGIPGLPSIMNVVILVSILSVGNSAIYASSRTLMSLDGLGHVKRYKYFNLGYIDRKGRPLVAIAFTLVFGLMAYGTLISETGATTMFNWLMALSGLSSLFTWASICFAHIRFRAGLKAQGRAVTELAYISPVGVAGSCYGLVLNLVVIAAQIWIAVSPVVGKPSISQVLKTILGLPVVLLFYGAHKVYKVSTVTGTTFYVRADKMDLDSGRREADIEAAGLLYEKERSELRAGPWWMRFYNFWC